MTAPDRLEQVPTEPNYEIDSDKPCPFLIRGLWDCGARTLEQGWYYSYRTDRRLVCLDEGHITDLEPECECCRSDAASEEEK